MFLLEAQGDYRSRAHTRGSQEDPCFFWTALQEACTVNQGKADRRKMALRESQAKGAYCEEPEEMRILGSLVRNIAKYPIPQMYLEMTLAVLQAYILLGLS